LAKNFEKRGSYRIRGGAKLCRSDPLLNVNKGIEHEHNSENQ